MNLRPVRIFFRQLRVIDAIRFFFLKVVQRVLCPWASSSYSQTGEDRIIATLLGGDSGFYVDVGCNHPIKFSNTFELYTRGWHGINVDPNEQLVALCQRIRPRDVSVCAAISDTPREAIFTEFADPLVSSLSADHIAWWRDHREVIGERRIVTRTLDDVLTMHNAPLCFDLLSIDVEGHDYEVLSSLNLEAFRPKLIVIEVHNFPIGAPNRNKTWEHLNANGYELIAYAIMNAYFWDARK